MSLLRVGLTYKIDAKAEPYRMALRAASLEPVDLTVAGRPALSGLKGLLLSGGSDVDPKFYGRTNDGSKNIDPARDEMESRLLHQALAARIPVFAICRGLQLLNVALGGSLLQHIDDHNLLAAKRHAVAVEPGTLLGRILGHGAHVNSRHHQAADPGHLGRGLRVSACAADGTVEGLEREGEGYVLAVQWHPEDMPDMAALFEDFRQAVSRVP